MKRLCPSLLLVVCCLLSAWPAAAAEPPADNTPPAAAAFPGSAMTPQPHFQALCSALGVCCDSTGYCWLLDPGPFGDPDGGCTFYRLTCGPKTYGECTFVKQKDNGKCLYDCSYSRTCTEITCDGSSQFTDYGTDRFKMGPYPPNACPYTIDPNSAEPEV